MEGFNKNEVAQNPCELSSRLTPEGFTHGIWTTEHREGSLHDEAHLRSKHVRIDVTTDYGGEQSKYKDRNEDTFLVMSNADDLLVGVIDGAGGSIGADGKTKGRKAAVLATEALRRIYEHSPETEVSKAMEVLDAYVSKNAEGGFATGVVVRGIRINNEWSIEIGATGDSKIITIRGNHKIPEATSTLQNMGQFGVTLGNKPENYYIDPRQNAILGGFGLSARQKGSSPAEILSFKGKDNDQMIVASDGFWDIVSEYEVIELSKQYRGKALQQQLYELAHHRNNCTEPFMIQHDATTTVVKEFNKMHPDFVGQPMGDNLTIAVIDLLPPKKS
jgi:serine/threonine protein phosphatase PrpC